MVPHEALIKALRSRGYSYKGQSDRVTMWKRPGSAKRIMVRKHSSHSEEAARSWLKQAGMSDDEIDRFIASVNN